MNQLVTFYLKGELGKLYGSEFRFAATSIAHGLRSMCYQLKGDDKTDPFIDVLSKGYYSVIRDGREIDIDELNVGLGKTKDVYIVPVPEGEGGQGGAGKFIFGALLVTGALLLAGPGGAGLAGGFTLGGTSGVGISLGQIAAIGGLIGAAGAAQLLSPTPGAADTRVREAPEERPSFLIDSLTNTTEEGAPVPIIHGTKIMIGSHVLSSGLDVEQTALEDLIEVESDFTSVHVITPGIELSSGDNLNTEFRGYSTGTIGFVSGAALPFNFDAMGSTEGTLFRNKQILEIVEGHADSPPPNGSQHFLRVSMIGSPIDYFDSIKIEQPSGSLVFLKLTNATTNFFSSATPNFGSTQMQDENHVIVTIAQTVQWEWSIAAPFILDGTTELTVTFGYT